MSNKLCIPFVTVKGAADLLSVSGNTICERIRKERLAALKHEGKFHIPLYDVARLMKLDLETMANVAYAGNIPLVFLYLTIIKIGDFSYEEDS